MGSPVRTALETRASLVSVLRGFFLFFVTLGGWCFGSPVERCALGVLLIVLGHCQAYCKPWLQAVVGCAVFTIGPSSEAYTTYTERAILGAASEAYSILWLDTFSFFLMMTITYPLVAAMLNMPLRAYAINLVVILPVGSFFAIGLPPAWAVAHAGRIFCLLLTSGSSDLVGAPTIGARRRSPSSTLMARTRRMRARSSADTTRRRRT